MKGIFAALLLAAAWPAAAQQVDPSPDRAVDEPLYDLQRREETVIREGERRDRDDDGRLRVEGGETGLPDRLEPERTFPGELPIQSTTSGSLDRSGRAVRDNRTNAAPTFTPGAGSDEDRR